MKAHDNLDSIQSTMVKLCSESNSRMVDRCVNNNSTCKFNKSKFETYLKEPYPKVLILNISWQSNEVAVFDTLAFAISITHRFKTGDLFS